MDREDDDEVKADVPEESKSNIQDSENRERDKISVENFTKTNKSKEAMKKVTWQSHYCKTNLYNGIENMPSSSSIKSGESCGRMYLEDNQFVIESPCGSGDWNKVEKAETADEKSERSECDKDKDTIITNSHTSTANCDSGKQESIPESSKKSKKAPKNPENQSEFVDSKDISSTSKDSEGMSFVTEYGKSKRGISEGQEGDRSRVSVDESKSSSDPDSSKRQKTDETMSGSLDGVDKRDDVPLKFFKLKSKVRKRNYRVKQNLPDDLGDNSDEFVAGESNGEEMETVNAEEGLSDQDSALAAREDSNLRGDEIADDEDREFGGNSEVEEDDESEDNSELEDGEDRDDDDSNEHTSASEDDSDEGIPPVLQKEKPKPQWFVVPEVIKRQLGNNDLFQRRFYGSLHTVQRLELMYKLKEHEGCVNTLSFNQRGNLLASGSDDLSVVIWDWPLGKKHHSFKTGHRSNVFQASWLPMPSENLMVTCARDGYVRLADLNKTTSKSLIGCTWQLASHKGPATALSIHPEIPQVILSVGKDAKVFAIDIRQSKPTTLLTVKEGLSHIAIYSIDSNPLNSNEFCLGGRNQYVRLYDKRKVSTPLYKLCPENLRNNKYQAHVTCALYNYNGSEILASYNDEDIYLFDTLLPYPIGDFVHKYQGHRNNATVKGVNFFGPKSEFVISGSDCGNIFIWEKNTEAIVQWMAGDESGVVNRLEPHPHIPVLATSGLDYDVKVWVPSCEESPSMKNLDMCVKNNMKSRARDVSREPNAFDGDLLWFLWRHATETQEPRSRGHGLGRYSDTGRDEEGVDTSHDETSNNSNSPSEDETDGRPQCSPS